MPFILSFYKFPFLRYLISKPRAICSRIPSREGEKLLNNFLMKTMEVAKYPKLL